MTPSVMRALRFICAAWILPAGFSLVAFFGFFTNYTTDVFSVPGLLARYEGSVFRYRVLGRKLVASVAAWLESWDIAWEVPRALTLFDPSASGATYWAYMLVHIVFTCAGCSILLLTLRRHAMNRDDGNAELVVAGVALLTALAAFVVTPYDALFFALQIAALALTLRQASPATTALLAGVTVLAMLTRETAYFLPAFYLAVHHSAVLARNRARMAGLVASAAALALTYVALRTVYGWRGGSVYSSVQVAANTEWTALAGSAMLLASAVLLLSPGPNLQARVWYAALSAPYVVFVHVFAAPWEWRLWMPIVVPLVVLRVIPDAIEWQGGRPIALGDRRGRG
jgi:hypothetical protein